MDGILLMLSMVIGSERVRVIGKSVVVEKESREPLMGCFKLVNDAVVLRLE